MKKSLIRISVALLFAVPSLIFRIMGIHADPIFSVFIYGMGIVVAAIILSWAAEAAQIDISSSFAVAILALIAVLPEYAVDLYFSFTAGSKPEFVKYAAANMTGSNRLLIGIGWSVVVIAYVVFSRMKNKQKNANVVLLAPKIRVELAFLLIASVYCLVIPYFKRISIVDSFVLIPLFFIYMFKVSNEEQEDTELVGTAAGFLRLSKVQRFFSVNSLFAVAGGIVLAAAQPFADSLIGVGKQFKLDEFLLVQWIAPLATEAPELIVAVIYAMRNKGNHAIGTLLSSKINQWTLLVGSLPIAFYIGNGGKYAALNLDIRQNEEFLLTAAQAILGFAILSDLKFTLREAIILLGMFGVQFFIISTEGRVILAIIYFVIAFFLLIYRRKSLVPIGKSLFKSKHE